jgi:peroxiredoxin
VWSYERGRKIRWEAPKGASTLLWVRMRRAVSLSIIGLTLLLAGGCLESNAPPTASFTRSPLSGSVPHSVFFDATSSADSDGAIASYSWNFGDGSTGDGVTPTHTFSGVGTFSVVLTVADDRGKQAETLRMVDVTASDAPPPVGTEIGQRAPEIVLADVRTGEMLSLSSFRGHVVLLEFWRSTCSSCRVSMPGMEALRAKFADDGVLVVLVSEDVSAAAALDMLVAQGYDDVVALFDAGEAARSLYGVDLIPRVFIIDRQGVVRYEDHPIRIRDRHITPWL